jgi:hypothetical protein
MSERRGSGYLVTGLIIGLILGLTYSRSIAPAKYIDTIPSALEEDSKGQLRSMIALAYMYNKDLGRAEHRLALLEDEQPTRALLDQAELILTMEGSLETVKALKSLAYDLELHTLPPDEIPTEEGEASEGSSAIPIDSPGEVALAPTATMEIGQVIFTPTSTSTSTPTPVYTYTPRPTSTPFIALSIPFTLKQQEEVCDATLPEGLLQVLVEDEEGEPVPGARISVSWVGGEDSFFTGLYPLISLGYADFIMSPELVYRVRVGTDGDLVGELALPICEGEESEYFGGWYLRFGPRNQSAVKMAPYSA